MRTGSANLPLHSGHCPRWLYERMVKLAAEIAEAVVQEFSPEVLLARLADPVWFQAFGAVLGFDWHSSGLTTVTTAALKEGLADRQQALGIYFAGGKGRASRKTPEEITVVGDRLGLPMMAAHLVDTSRLVAKVDNTALQDGYQLYHHVFAFTAQGSWAVVQQGLPTTGTMARRYHWLSETVRNPVSDPHRGIAGDEAATSSVLDMTASKSEAARTASLALIREVPDVEIQQGLAALANQVNLTLPSQHAVPRAGYLNRVLYRLYERPPEDFSGLLLTEGVGPGTLRALVMVAEMIYGVEASRTDPVRYSFAHGGKDGHPFPVARSDYDHSLAVLRRAVEKARLGHRESMDALSRLARVAKDWPSATHGD